MKVTSGQIKYGFGKCVTCERVIALDSFRQWEEDGVLNRERECTPGRRGGAPDIDGCPSPTHRGMAFFESHEIIRMAKAVPCTDCQRMFPTVCMDFDHRPECGKTENVAMLKSRKKEILLAEIAKCDVVCACCHRLRTQRRGYAGTGRPVRTPPDTAGVAPTGR